TRSARSWTASGPAVESRASWRSSPIRRPTQPPATARAPTRPSPRATRPERRAPTRRTAGHPAVTSLAARMFETIDHVGIAVLDLERAAGQYAAFGMPLVHRETVESQGVDAALLDVGPAHVELLQPLGPETVVGRFIAKRGEGLHHVAYRVENI